MARYFFSIIFSLAALACSVFSGAVAALSRAFDFAFPAAAARERLPLAVTQSEAIIYATGLSRTRAFLARQAQRNDGNIRGFGALGLPAFA